MATMPKYPPARTPRVWLTSFWGFSPEVWGCLGFTQEWMRQEFIDHSQPGDLVAIYVTKGEGPEEMRGRVVGVIEVTNNRGLAAKFVAPERWMANDRDPKMRGKWQFAVQTSRAWRIIQEQWPSVEEIFGTTYATNNLQRLGAIPVRVMPVEAERLLQLHVTEVKVYNQARHLEAGVQTLLNVLRPSSAIQPPSEPYWVGETDGPKHLYILQLMGNMRAYLADHHSDIENKVIAKVGFSRSPSTRCAQIQSAYPDGKYKWELFRPNPVPEEPPYSCAKVAIAGEDAMKGSLLEHGVSLGREFFLADTGALRMAWAAGLVAAEEAEKHSSTASR